MSNIATIANTAGAAVQSAEERSVIAALRDSFYPGARAESVAMVLGYCRAAGLDPMTRPVHIVPMSVKNPVSGQYEFRDVVMPGIELYRIKADRSGKYAGQDDAEFGPDVERWGITFPAWCKVVVYKITDAGRVPYSAKVFWLESYSTAKKDSDAPNAMWKKRPYGMLEKCAEAAVLRKAFPEIGGQPTADEMAGKSMSDEPERDMGQAQVIHEPAPSTSRTADVKARLSAKRKPSEPAPDLDDVLSAIAGAETPDALKAAATLAGKLVTDEDKAVARQAYADRKSALEAPPDLELTPPDAVAQILAGIARANPEDAATWLEEAREQGLSAEEMARVEAAIEARKA
jgi:phage recombination protein Bet